MKERKLIDQELETLAKSVVVAGSNAVDIDGVVSDPKLFNSVLAKIAAEYETKPTPSRFAWKPAAAFAAAIILISASFVIYFGSRSEAPRVSRSTIPDTIDEIKPSPYVQSVKEPEALPDENEVIKTVSRPPREAPRAIKHNRTKRVACKRCGTGISSDRLCRKGGRCRDRRACRPG